jgi:hypothetical protein
VTFCDFGQGWPVKHCVQNLLENARKQTTRFSMFIRKPLVLHLVFLSAHGFARLQRSTFFAGETFTLLYEIMEIRYRF